MFQEQVEEAKDARLSADLMGACSADVESLCSKDVPPDGVLACLKENDKQLRKRCKKAVFQGLKEQSVDMRLDPALLEACQGELTEFCTDVKFGDGDKKTCLFESRSKTGFGQPCREAVEKAVGFAARDARLNPKLPAFCERDLKRLCPVDDEVTNAATDAPDATSLDCMMAHLAQIRSAKCSAEVKRVGGAERGLGRLGAGRGRVRGGCAAVLRRLDGGDGRGVGGAGLPAGAPERPQRRVPRERVQGAASGGAEHRPQPQAEARLRQAAQGSVRRLRSRGRGLGLRRRK